MDNLITTADDGPLGCRVGTGQTLELFDGVRMANVRRRGQLNFNGPELSLSLDEQVDFNTVVGPPEVKVRPSAGSEIGLPEFGDNQAFEQRPAQVAG